MGWIVPAALLLWAGCVFEGAPGRLSANTDAAVDGVPGADADTDAVSELCGNGAIDGDEDCDDDDTEDLDGCSASCAIEPGFECEVPGPCRAVNGVAWSGPASPNDGTIGDSMTGAPFTRTCADGEVAIGFAGGAGTNCGGAAGVAQLETVCAPLTFDGDGVAVHGNSTALPLVGICDPDNGVFTASSIACAEGSVLVGVSGNGGGFLDRLEGVCRPVSHQGGALVIGDAEVATGTIGPGNADEDVSCPAGQVVVSITGGSGQVVDILDVRCAALATTLL